MKRKQKPGYEQNPPAAPRRQVPGAEARMAATSLGMDAPRVAMTDDAVVDRINAVTGNRYQYPDGGQGRMIFDSAHRGLDKNNTRGR